MIAWLRAWWWKRQRSIDLQVLWPQCKKVAPSLHSARAAFMRHAMQDPAWIRWYGEDRLIEEVGKLR